MQDFLLENKPDDSVPLMLVAEDAFDQWLRQQNSYLKRWIMATGFSAKPGRVCLVPDTEGRFRAAVVGIKSPDDIWACGGLPSALPSGSYYIDGDWSVTALERFALGWGLGAYEFTRYRESTQIMARLVLDPACDAQGIKQQVKAITLVRDLVNTPAEDMMPSELADAMQALAGEFGAQFEQVIGDELLAQNFPVIHAVGRASDHAPRLLDLRWGDEIHPRLTLVGKGVCFDSGGLDLKSANSMRLMKKDMGGAAHVIGLAQLVMSAELPVRLRVLVPAVENAVSGRAYRPGDVLRSRKGLTIEVDNTDAEGRLILCDALAEGSADNPDLLIDFATLTGAARVAMGTEIPVLFTNSDEMAAGLMEASERVQDPIWRLPLHQPYREMLKSKIADIANATNSPYGGAITAALFLQKFVPEGLSWAHFDMMAWNTRGRPGRPEGGEAMGLRTVFGYLQRRFGS